MRPVLRTLARLLIGTFGPVFPELEGFDPAQGQAAWSLRNDALTAPGERGDIVVFSFYPPGALAEASWLHPLPLSMKLNTTDADPSAWRASRLKFCGQGFFDSAEALRDAHERGEVRVCAFGRAVGAWNLPRRATPPLPEGRALKEAHGGVAWGPWTFTVSQNPSSGPALLDVRFRGERVLYELAMQDALAAYSGDESSQFFYLDAAYSLSMLGASLSPGVDCPRDAHYLSMADYYVLVKGGTADSDPTRARDFWPICVFEFTEDHSIWRHMGNDIPTDVRGLVRRTVVVRSIATVGNYDYLTDVKLREDGEIEVKTQFAGYIESRYFGPHVNPQERNFSTIVRPDLAGPVHSHLVNWKADIDVAGARANALRLTKVKAGPVPGSTLRGTNAPLVSKYLEYSLVDREGVGTSTFVAHPEHPTNWAVVDRAATSASGNPRGYAIALNSFCTTQVLPGDHPFVKAIPLTQYHLAVTKYHDSEYRSSSVYAQYDGQTEVEREQRLDHFLEDGEQLIDEDLVAWIGVGREHIVRQEDLPVVSNFGAGFSLQPWNFFTQNVAASPLAQ
uniref:Amine oxidase n=1 Tax=Zooxanthella nutricula TaxID=1333877 RepID=A0A7S2JQ83_9DINO